MQKQHTTKQAKIKLAKKITQSRLENIAMHYLSRFGGTEKTLRDMLNKRIKKSMADHPEQDINQIGAWVDTVVESAKKYGYVNDVAYAKSKIASLIKKGNSKKLIISKLKPKGISTDTINEIIETEHSDSELQSAILYAQKRKLGIYSPDYDGNINQKHLASMARRGFSYETSKLALENQG